jgi:hypothetical protein
MARGGARPGAGRKKGKPNRKNILSNETAIIAKNCLPPELPENHILPLDHMLRVLNDPNAPPDRKDRMAALAAPFCHARMDVKGGKKAEKDEKARQAGTGRFAAANAPKIVQMKKQG